MQIFVHSRGQRLGPLALEEVNRQLQAGQISPDDLAWHEGLPTWTSLRSIQGVVLPNGIFPSQGAAIPSPASVSPVIPPATSVVASAKTDPLAICSLVFGILGIVCCGTFLMSVVAIVCGHICLSNTKKDPSLRGRELATAGMIMGYVGLVIGVFSFISYMLMGFAPAFTEGLK